MINKILVSSDHHANWKALEYWFEYASKNNLPFIIPGDVVGDYNFHELAAHKNLSIPSQYEDNEDTFKLKDLFNEILLFHAKKLAEFIDKYKVKTYFLHGNHEPIYFTDMVVKELSNKELFVDISKQKGFIKVGEFKIAGISNTIQLMPYLYSIFSEQELNEYFSHQRGHHRKSITNLSKDKLDQLEDPIDDVDWIRIMTDNDNELDIFFTHGQIGIGAWRKDKYASEIPTLLAAAKLSNLAKLTVDGHLHTTHAMRNDLGKPNIRAVGNCAYLVEKQPDGRLSLEELNSNKPYNARGGITLSDLEGKKNISEIDRFLGL